MNIKHLLKKSQFLRRLKGILALQVRCIQEYSIFRHGWMRSRIDIHTTGYDIIINAHALEKGMSHTNPRPFGVERTAEIMRSLILYEKRQWSQDYAYNFGVSILQEYCTFYKNQRWDSLPEYHKVASFIQHRNSKLTTGTQEIHKSDCTKAAAIDYDSFLSSRHSIRNFSPKPLSDADITRAVRTATKTPTACNRQMIKIYYIKNKSQKNKILKFAHGLTGFNNQTVNIFVITHDISSLCNAGEISQGYFNAGLVAMNFVNALHSEGIGSCLLEFNNNRAEEKQLRHILNIPKHERVTVMMAAGYYPEKTIIPKSTRKPIEEIYKKIV